MEQECVWDNRDEISGHLKAGIEWYEENYVTWEQKHKACVAAVKAYDETDSKCDSKQAVFEVDTCGHRQALWTSCHDHYATACKACSVEFDEKVNEVECREKDRKVDYSAAEKIRCYINVLVSSPSDEELKEHCDANGENCLTNARIEQFKACEDVCHDVDFESGAGYQVIDGVNGTHRSESEDEKRCTRVLDINFPAKTGCEPCPELPPYPCETEFVTNNYAAFQKKEWTVGVPHDTKECSGYMHQEWFAYSLAECIPCPQLIGRDPTNHDARCQAYGNEVHIQTDGGHDTWLNLGEIIVNRGASLTAQMSHIYSAGTTADKCLDGNPDTICHAEVGGWIEVKLEAPTCIEHIKVINRNDVHSRRIVGGHIKIRNQGTTVWQSGFTEDKKVYEWSFSGNVGLAAPEPLPPAPYTEEVDDTTFQNIKVVDIDHVSGKQGQYFNFDWAGDLGKFANGNFQAKQCRQGEAIWEGTVKVWNSVNGGQKGDSHGRRNSGYSTQQWQIGDMLVHAGAHCPLPEAGCDESTTAFQNVDYRGCQSRTRSNRECQKWTAQSPHAHSRKPENYPNFGLGDHNYCRNPDEEGTIWCYTTDPASRWELCDPLPQKAIVSKSPGTKCPYNHQDRVFRLDGVSSVRECERSCQATIGCSFYTYQAMGTHGTLSGAGDHDGVCMGCATADNLQAHVGFNTYALPQHKVQCDESTSATRRTDYRGCQSQTRGGKECQKWTAQYPHANLVYNPDSSPGKGLGDHNYCRNPDEDETIWCYTMHTTERWDYCNPL
jgi:hypothetical protein